MRNPNDIDILGLRIACYVQNEYSLTNHNKYWIYNQLLHVEMNWGILQCASTV